MRTSWRYGESGLKEEFLNDRKALARLRNPKFKHGYVEVEDEEVDELLRSLTELRLTLREHSLGEISDEQLENGEVEIESKKSTGRIGYFAYLVMAEIQERIILAVVISLSGGCCWQWRFRRALPQQFRYTPGFLQERDLNGSNHLWRGNHIGFRSRDL